MVYIRQSQLPKLKEYKYSGVDKSLVSKYILKPFWWSKVIELFPLSMAPNAITLSGFGFVIFNFLTMLWYNPTMDQDMPSWVYATWAVGLFLYQTFDAIDGSQARRTGQSGPLGELFDHGVDACNTTLEVVLFSAAMNLGQGWQTVLILFATSFTFYVQTWDEYYTKTLTLGIVSGPVEGVLTLCAVFAITAVKGGGSFWHTSMFETIGVPRHNLIPDDIYDLPFTTWFMVYGGLVLVFNTVQSSLNVLSHVRKNPLPRSRSSPLLDLVPSLAMWVLVAVYLYMQPVILHYHLVPFVFYVGTVNAYLVGKIIVAHLTKNERFPWNNILVAPLVISIADSLGPRLGLWPSSILGDDVYQVAFMFACLGLGLGVYGSFVHDVITTICDYLDIWCLTIKYPKKSDKKSS